MFSQHGVVLAEAELKEQSGRTNASFVEIINRRYGYDFDPKVLAAEKDQLVLAELAAAPARPYSGAIELLQKLGKLGIKRAISTTAGRNTASRMGELVWPYFEVIVCREEITKSKPDPEMFLTAAKELGLPPADCVVFEDAKNGVEAAKAGGFFCIARDNQAGQDLSAADSVITAYNPQELAGYFS
ncbi:MAG: HAD family hydrolase [Candidatus Liptonbacteria bacterium]|nr:HAD family hydrolase [Candidatus Liptonbacteria bacterium]